VILVSLAVGLGLLGTGAHLLVRGAARLAAVAGVSPFIIGLTVVAFGTSAPELAISVVAGWRNLPDLVVGTVVGSNIYNVLFILGICGTILPLSVAQRVVRLDVPLLIGTCTLTWLLALGEQLGKLDGAAFMLLLMTYVGFLIVQNRRHGLPASEYAGHPGVARRRPGTAVGLILAGAAALAIGAPIAVDATTQAGQRLGIGELSMGLAVLAIGSSLPETATSIAAALRGERDIAVGNAIGSSIFNLLGVLGITALVAPHGLEISATAVRFDLPVMIGVSVLCLPIFISGSVISRFEAALFLLYYAVYMTLVVLRGVNSALADPLDGLLAYLLFPATAAALTASLFVTHKHLKQMAASLTNDVEGLALQAVAHARKIVVLVTGGSIIAVGSALLVLPGPGVLIILLGLVVLGTEFLWAKRFLTRLQDKVKESAHYLTQDRNGDAGAQATNSRDRSN
jgi:cation:H+ antiporter